MTVHERRIIPMEILPPAGMIDASYEPLMCIYCVACDWHMIGYLHSIREHWLDHLVEMEDG